MPPIQFLLDTFGVVFEPTVTEVWEDAGQVEMFKIVKQGETEQVVNVMLSCLEIGERLMIIIHDYYRKSQKYFVR